MRVVEEARRSHRPSTDRVGTRGVRQQTLYPGVPDRNCSGSFSNSVARTRSGCSTASSPPSDRPGRRSRPPDCQHRATIEAITSDWRAMAQVSSKNRFGRSEARRRFRMPTSTVGRNASWSLDPGCGLPRKIPAEPVDLLTIRQARTPATPSPCPTFVPGPSDDRASSALIKSAKESSPNNRSLSCARNRYTRPDDHRAPPRVLEPCLTRNRTPRHTPSLAPTHPKRREYFGTHLDLVATAPAMGRNVSAPAYRLCYSEPGWLWAFTWAPAAQRGPPDTLFLSRSR